MKRTLPENLVCTVTIDGNPVEGIAIRAILEADFKNSYGSIFGPTDKDGRAQLSQQDILRDATENLKMGLMDFGPIEKCFTGRVFLHVMNTKDLEGAMGAYIQFKKFVEYPPDYQQLLQNSIDTSKKIETEKLKLTAYVVPNTVELIIK